MNRIVIDAERGSRRISRHICGHFAEHLGRCIYGGFWVGTESPIPNTRGIATGVVEALRALNIPNLRWPGGCFADEYHWQDGIGPRAERPTMVNTHWGGVTENNHFGTHEFLDLCEQLGCEPYICGNVGSGTVQEMSQWVEYLTGDGVSPMADRRRRNGREAPWAVRYWGVGNENWGCGGHMRPEYYADLYRQYQTYCRNYGENRLFKIGCGPNGGDTNWTRVMMERAGPFLDGLSLHYYCGTGKRSRSATRFDAGDWFHLLQQATRMDDLLRAHRAVMDQFDPEGRVALIVDEWGTWHAVDPGTNPGFLHQQNTMRDALVAALTLHIFHDHCDRVRMANLAQTVNVLQAPLLTEGERVVKTPTFHVFEMFKDHQDALHLPTHVEGPDYTLGEEAMPQLSASASRRGDGAVTLTVCNTHHDQSVTVTAEARGLALTEWSGQLLTAAMADHNTVAAPETVMPRSFTEATQQGNALTVTLPPRAVLALALLP